MKNFNGQYCFKHSTGEDIYLFTLRNAKGTEVSITNYGAIITSFRVRTADGSYNDIVLGFDKVEDYLSEEYLTGYPYFGAAIGRYANRIKNGEFAIEGQKYTLVKNKTTDHLHGGDEGFDKKVWQYVSGSENTLSLNYKSPDGEEGYPGNLKVELRFILNDNNELNYEYFAQTDQPTAVNLTHHSYFNLDNGAGSIADHQVRIYSSAILEQDDNFVVNGNMVDVGKNLYDFRQSKKIGLEWNPEDGYDQSYVLDDQSRNLKLAAEASSAQSNLKLEVYTTEPLVHFYTGKWIPVVGGRQGNNYGPFSGFCFETQKHPNAVNIPAFPNTILLPGKTYHTITKYKVIS